MRAKVSPLWETVGALGFVTALAWLVYQNTRKQSP